MIRADCLQLGLLLSLAATQASADSLSPLSSPNWQHWLGTDLLGRDVTARTLEAAYYTLSQTLLVLILSVAVGIVMGASSALQLGRFADRLIVLLAESLRAFPTLLLVLLFATAGMPATLFLAAYFWIPVWRIARPALAAQQRQPYALNARLMGMGRLRMLVTEVGPNVLPGTIPYFASLLAEILAVQAALEFLGFGPPIEQPSLGGMLLSATQLGFVAPWVWLPSLVIIIAVVNLTALVTRRTQRANLSVPLG